MTIARVMIIGGPGAGKTWLAHLLSQQLALPVYSVDDAVWDSNGNIRPAEKIDRLVREMAKQERWIIEGGNSRTYTDRAVRADLVVRLAPPLWLRMFRVLRRDGLNFRLLRGTTQYDRNFAARDHEAMAKAKTSIEIRTST